MFRHGHRAFHPPSRMHCHRHGQSGREALTTEPLGLSCRKRSIGNNIRLSQATTDRPRAAPRAKGQPSSRRSLDNVTARPLPSQTKLHAAVRVAAGDRKRLEHLCRYAGRPAIAESRLSRLPAGRVAYSLKKTWRDGSTHVVLAPQVLMERLLALVRRPRRHFMTSHGVHGNRMSVCGTDNVPQVAEDGEEEGLDDLHGSGGSTGPRTSASSM